MAKYTELFSEYLEELGGLEAWTPPPEFELIEGFTDLFVTTFFDREIGFETPTLFTLKLNGRAALIIPPYASKITALNEALQAQLDPVKTRSKGGKITRTYGARTDKTTEQPFNTAAAQASPSQIFDGGAHTDTEEYDNYADTETGFTPAEHAQLIENLQKQVVNLKERCLNEFNNLFMLIY